NLSPKSTRDGLAKEEKEREEEEDEEKEGEDEEDEEKEGEEEEDEEKEGENEEEEEEDEEGEGEDEEDEEKEGGGRGGRGRGGRGGRRGKWVSTINRRLYEMVSIPMDKKVPLVDVAVNLANTKFSPDSVDYVLRRAMNAGVEKMILTSYTLRMSDKAILLAKRKPGVLFASVGVHPHFVKDEWNDKAIEVMTRLVALPEVVAVGVVGLDFHRNYSPEDLQIETFKKQAQLY
ncbi:hypothetical protein QZH41_013298, partial [Actinostola sp. cb2023]